VFSPYDSKRAEVERVDNRIINLRPRLAQGVFAPEGHGQQKSKRVLAEGKTATIRMGRGRFVESSTIGHELLGFGFYPVAHFES
jgi:hypothetical protein